MCLGAARNFDRYDFIGRLHRPPDALVSRLWYPKSLMPLGARRDFDHCDTADLLYHPPDAQVRRFSRRCPSLELKSKTKMKDLNSATHTLRMTATKHSAVAALCRMQVLFIATSSLRVQISSEKQKRPSGDGLFCLAEKERFSLLRSSLVVPEIPMSLGA